MQTFIKNLQRYAHFRESKILGDNWIGLAVRGIGQGIHVVEYSRQQFEADRIFVAQMEIRKLFRMKKSSR